MTLMIKNEQIEGLAAEVAEMAGESKLEAIRRALEERRDRLASRVGSIPSKDILLFLKREIWPLVSKDVRGKKLSKRERERILGWDRNGA